MQTLKDRSRRALRAALLCVLSSHSIAAAPVANDAATTPRHGAADLFEVAVDQSLECPVQAVSSLSRRNNCRDKHHNCRDQQKFG
jgi:hypothetical protein